MRKSTAFIIGAALVSVSFMATPAYADCAADIKKAQERLDGAQGQKNIGRFKIQMKLDRAKEDLEKGNKEKCAERVKKANKKMDKKGLH